ncbi:hypothetical protein D3C84_970380 [compost metagenome]
MHDFALCDELADCACNFFNWDIGIDAVLVKQINFIDLQPTEHAIDCFTQRRRAAVQTVARPVRIQTESELGCDVHVIPIGEEGITH